MKKARTTRNESSGKGRASVREPMTAQGLYDKQNKLLHKAFVSMCMPYMDNRMFWRATWSQEFKREVKGMSDLNLGERSRVLNGFSLKGLKIFTPFVPRNWMEWKKGDPEPKGGIGKRPMHVPAGKRAMVSKIHAILADMKLPWDYADGIARKRFGVEFVEWCQPSDLHKVVQMMVIYQGRHKKTDKGV
jgi:hypothetical protein